MRGAPPLYHTIESAHAPPRTFEKRTYEKVREARAAVLHELIPLLLQARQSQPQVGVSSLHVCMRQSTLGRGADYYYYYYYYAARELIRCSASKTKHPFYASLAANSGARLSAL